MFEQIQEISLLDDVRSEESSVEPEAVFPPGLDFDPENPPIKEPKQGSYETLTRVIAPKMMRGPK